jgi:parvulin-like peptidyl-prolyl isomerase
MTHMAKKKKLESKAPVPLTRGQLSRAEREKRQIRNLYTAGVAIGTLMLLLVGFAIISTYIIRPNAQVASVGGQAINRATYNKMRRWNIFQNIQTAAFQQQFGGTGTSIQGTEDLQRQLRGVDDEPLDATTVQQLINDAVLRIKSAEDYNVNPTRNELRDAALKDFEPQPTPPPAPTTDATATAVVTGTATTTITPTATSSPTPGSPTATGTATPTFAPVPGARQTAEATYSNYMQALDGSTAPDTNSTFCQLGCPDISEDDYLGLIVEPRVRREKVIESLAASRIVTDVEQINVQHILTTTREGALQIKAQLEQGADFTELANTQSKEQLDNIAQGNLPNGGNLGWFPREGSNLVKEFVEGAWPVPEGGISDPVFTSFGYHIIKVLDREVRPLEQATIDNLKNRYYTDWFNQAYDELRPTIQTNIPAATPIPTEAPLVEPTPPPAQTPAPQTPAGGQTPTTTTDTPGPETTPGAANTPSVTVEATPAAGGATATPSASTPVSPTQTLTFNPSRNTPTAGP